MVECALAFEGFFSVMKILCKQKVNTSDAAMKDLQMLLECIGSSEFKWITEKIKSLPEKAQRRKQKVSYLPAAFPSLKCIEGCQEVGSISDTNHLEPTGIVQFDLDLQDNLERLLLGQDNISELKAEIVKLTGLVYLFVSPSGGLKFGVKTDFERADGEAFKDMSRRFALVYDRLSQKISSAFDVELDGSMANIKQAMFLSYDPEYFYNPNPEVIFINDWSHSELDNNLEEETKSQPSYNHKYSIEFARQVLSFIPQDLTYVEATSINYAFLSIYGESGVEILANHWVGESKTDVNKLKYFLGGNVNNPIGVLINAARKYACDGDRSALNQMINNSSGIRKQRPVPVDIELPDLLTPEEGKYELEKTIESFCNSRNNVYIKASGGLGKTDAVLKYIGKLPDDKKVLFLVKTYQNAEEIVCRFKEVFSDTKRISVAQGKVRSCKNEDIKRQYIDNGMPLPSYECLYNCAVKDQCGYILSRRHDDQIRVMTHEEYYVSQSIWAHGYTLDASEARSQYKDVKGLKPKLLGWKPDFVVVDEDHFKPDFCELSASDHWRSPGTIIHGIRNGLSLGDAINASIDDLTEDLIKLWGLSRRKIVFTNRRQYIAELKRHAAQLKGKELIKCFEQIMSGNTEDLSRISVDLEARSLTLHRMKQPAVRYENVPTLFLDATANEVVVRSQLRDVMFKEIFVKKSPCVSTMMYSNVNFSR